MAYFVDMGDVRVNLDAVARAKVVPTGKQPYVKVHYVGRKQSEVFSGSDMVSAFLKGIKSNNVNEHAKGQRRD